MKKLICLLLAAIMLISFTGCKDSDNSEKTESESTDTAENSSEDNGKKEDKPRQEKTDESDDEDEEEKETYGPVSRPIKEFWVMGFSSFEDEAKYLMTLTENNEIYFGLNGPTDTPNFVISDVKDVHFTNTDKGCFVLNNGDLVFFCFDSNSDRDLQLKNLDPQTLAADIDNATVSIQTDRYFGDGLVLTKDGSLKCTANGETVVNGRIKDAAIVSYNTDYEPNYATGLFLYDGADGRLVQQYLDEYENRDNVLSREIARDVAWITYKKDDLSSNHSCCIVKKDGELLCIEIANSIWDHELTDPRHIASDAKVDEQFPIYYEGDEVVYVNKDNKLIKYDPESKKSEVLCSGVKKLYTGYAGYNTKYEMFVLTDKNELVSLNNTSKPWTNELASLDNTSKPWTDVKDLVNGIIIHLDGSATVLRTERFIGNDVKYAYCTYWGDDIRRRFILRENGGLYLTKDYEAKLYKSPFCEKNIELYCNGTRETLTSAIQIADDMPLLPYHELSNILNVSGLYDSLEKTVTVEGGSTKLEFTVDSKKYKKNGSEMTMDAAVYIDEAENVWIPIDIVAKALGYSYKYDEAQSKIEIRK